ncbi:hypothetical protein H4R33_006933 [Dimargaris cristalligena]|nr:hypothetical protein H4R33_006933 [Dimargaris cristalligena]
MQLPSLSLLALIATTAITVANAAVLPSTATGNAVANLPVNLAHASNGDHATPVNQANSNDDDDDDPPHKCGKCGLKFYNTQQYLTHLNEHAKG